MSTFLFSFIHYPPLIALASTIIHLHHLILLLRFFFFSPSSSYGNSNTAEVKQRWILQWYDGIAMQSDGWEAGRGKGAQLDVMETSWFSFVSNILTLAWLQRGSRGETEHVRGKKKKEKRSGEETNRCLNLSAVSASISRCPALIRTRLLPTPANISLLFFLKSSSLHKQSFAIKALTVVIARAVDK